MAVSASAIDVSMDSSCSIGQNISPLSVSMASAYLFFADMSRNSQSATPASISITSA